VVYEAVDTTTERRVAVKVLQPDVLDDQELRKKLMLEARVAGRVGSEHIVDVLQVGVDEETGCPYLVMEHLKGADLQRLVEREGPIAAPLTVEYLRQVAAGLDKAHACKNSEQQPAPIVHRDLKPENLFLTHREDGTPWVKILDFGTAKVLEPRATASTTIRGTPLYMAPEQVGGQALAPATDVWALGLIAFFLLTGRVYWKTGQDGSRNQWALFSELKEGATDPPSQRVGALGVTILQPPAFDTWFIRCVHRDPTQRFQVAGEAVCELAAALGVSVRESHPAESAPTLLAVALPDAAGGLPEHTLAYDPTLDVKLDAPQHPNTLTYEPTLEVKLHLPLSLKRASRRRRRLVFWIRVGLVGSVVVGGAIAAGLRVPKSRVADAPLSLTSVAATVGPTNSTQSSASSGFASADRDSSAAAPPMSPRSAPPRKPMPRPADAGARPDGGRDLAASSSSLLEHE
jgi:serine/threonine-protein kinase